MAAIKLANLPFDRRPLPARVTKSDGPLCPSLLPPIEHTDLTQSAIETQRRSAARDGEAHRRLPTSERRLAGFPRAHEYAGECGQLRRWEIYHVEASSRSRIARTADTGESVEAC